MWYKRMCLSFVLFSGLTYEMVLHVYYLHRSNKWSVSSRVQVEGGPSWRYSCKEEIKQTIIIIQYTFLHNHDLPKNFKQYVSDNHNN